MSGIPILVVEDEDDVRRHLVRAIRRHGFEVDQAEDGGAAIEAFDQRHYSVILLDLRMPGLDGLRVLEHVKKESPDTEVVILTGHGTRDDAIQALNLHAHRYLTKPPNIDDIIAALRSAADAFQDGSFAGEPPPDEPPDLSDLHKRMREVDPWDALRRPE